MSLATGAITAQYIDVAQLVLYCFWIFFAGLIYYLHRENKREGYPLRVDVTRCWPAWARAAWAGRADVPDMTTTGHAAHRAAAQHPSYGVAPSRTPIRAATRCSAPTASAGTVVDLWVDRSEAIFRYLEVEVAAGGRRVLLPMTLGAHPAG
jgi:photosynthetic reaction center H subunit